MKAYRLNAIKDFVLEEVEKPRYSGDEVLVAVRALGICGSDIPRIYTNGTYHYPLIPGHEFSGIVEELGNGVARKWLGKRVGVFPLIPCGKCRSCLTKQYECCRHYSYLGSRRNGGSAEYVSVPVWNLLELPEKVNYEQAAMLESMAVALHAMRRAGVMRDSKVAISSLGTIACFF